MRIQLATFAIVAVVLASFAAAAQRESMAPGNQSQGATSGSESQESTSQSRAAAEDANGSDVVEAEIVAIEGDNLIAETDSGEVFVLLVGDSADDFKLGDGLELSIDDPAESVVILTVIQQEEDEGEDEETES